MLLVHAYLPHWDEKNVNFAWPMQRKSFWKANEGVYEKATNIVCYIPKEKQV